MKPAMISIAAVLAYGGAYFAMVNATFDPWYGSGTIPVYYLPLVEQMRATTVDRIDRAARVVFAPVHAVDRRLRPRLWE